MTRPAFVTGTRLRRGTFALLSTLASAMACQNEAVPPTPPAVPTAQRAAAGTPNDDTAAQTKAEPAPYVYSYAGKRDPFRSYLSELHEREQAKNEGRVKEPTEEYDTSQFRLTAIISGGQKPSAMVEDPLGRGHVLRLGGRIGRNNGRVTNIDNTGMNIVEQFYDGTGKLLEVGSVLRLPSSEEVAPSAR